MTVDYMVGDVRDRLTDIPSGSVSLVASSPPFIALRSYLPADHPYKALEIGSEPDPATFIDTLLALTAEWGRVLAPWGSIAIELGDTFAGSGGAGGDYSAGGLREGQNAFDGSQRRHKGAWPRPKCLALIPQAYALSLAYGRNILTGETSPAGQWLVRNVVVWHRPNPAVGALGDKFRPSTSYITVATNPPRNIKRWFDLTAVRNANSNVTLLATGYAMVGGAPSHDVGPRALNPAGAPPLDCWFDEFDGGHETWTLTTQPSSLAHYAMWPAKLAERLVLSMCPLEVCTVCNEPRRRIEKRDAGRKLATVPLINDGGIGTHGDRCSATTTLGWSDCGHGSYRPGVVLDPFAGTGTTLAVADLHGRNGIGIDIDSRNQQMYEARHAEVKRALFGATPELPGQLGMFAC